MILKEPKWDRSTF